VAIRNRLYPRARQEQVLVRHCDDARFVWNLAVEQQSWWWPGRGSAPNAAEQQRQLAEARAAEPWLAGGSSSVQQQALRDFDHAMTAFFDPDNPARKPGFRAKRGTQGFVIRDTQVRRLNRRWGEVHVPKCGWVRFRWTRQMPAKLGMARVTLDRSGRWHVSLPAPQPAVMRVSAGAVVGVDRGVRTALVTSDGQHYRAPRINDRRAVRYLALQRRMGRQQKGSQKREKTRRAMARITAKVVDRRRDDPRFTSQQCHVCGHTAADNRDSQAVFRCKRCGHADHADANAARNILARGLAAIGSPCAGPGARGVCPHQPLAQASAAGTTRQTA
jgi:putative transposase